MGILATVKPINAPRFAPGLQNFAAPFPRIGTFCLIASLLWGAASVSAEVVYDNTTRSLNGGFVRPVEFGDEIILAGANRVVTNFLFKLFSSGLSGDEQARVRFYLNDGPPLPGVDAPVPGTVIYDSGFFSFPLNRGSLIAVPRLKVPVPDRFTWSIVFSGITQNEAAGLQLFSPPSIGINFEDYWEHSGNDWTLRTSLDGTAIDFGALMEATASLDDNTAPFISFIPDQQMDQDTTIRIPFSVRDFETASADLVLAAASTDPNLVPPDHLTLEGSGSDRVLQIIPAANQTGATTILLSVTDPSGWTDTLSFQLSVNPVNHPPTITLLPDQVVDEDTPTPAIPFAVDDLETPPANLVLGAFSSDPSLVPNGNILFSGNGSSRAVTVVPAANQAGTALIAVTVTDSGGLTASRTFRVTINPVNDPPAISEIPPQVTNEDTPTGVIAFTVGDVETPAASLAVFGHSSNTALVPNENIALAGEGPNRTVRITPAPNQFGTATITVVVTDEGGLTSIASFTITVNPVNDLPAITPIADQITRQNSAPLLIAFMVGDLETPADGLNISVTSENTQLIPSENLVLGGSGNNRTLSITPAADLSGTARIVVTVADESGGTASNSFQVTVLPGDGVGLPQITQQPQSQTVAIGASVTLTVEAIGPGPFTYQWRLNGADIGGASSASYSIPVFNLEQAGNYHVIVANAFGAVDSQIARLLPAVDPFPLADDFNARPTFTALSAVGISNNFGATLQAGEPSHAGKPGGHSVWFRWVAPGNGIATFRTTGSSFDTLLAVYRGESLGELVPLANDDDSGGFFTSQAAFNAIGGEAYQIAVDGFAGALGVIVVSWNLEITTDVLPVILVQPQDQAVAEGAPATFTVAVQDAAGLSYQWFFRDSPLPGQTNPALTINNVQPDQVGNYRVEVRLGTRSVRSHTVALEIGSGPDVFSSDKFQDVFTGGGGGVSLQSRKRPGRSGFASVAAGTLGTQTMDNSNSTTEQGEPNHGGVAGGSSRWFRLIPQANGLMVVDTSGSAIDTALAVYRGNNLLNLTLVSSNHRAPEGGGSLVKFNAGRGTNYLVAVDGVEGAQGKIRLNWKLGIAPSITAGPASQEAAVGESVSFTATASGAPAPAYQWQFNGVNLPGATGAILQLTNLQASQSGSYRVVASNFAGTATSDPAALTVHELVPIRIGAAGLNGGQLQFGVAGPAGRTVRIESSTDLIVWTQAGLIPLAQGEGTFTENVAPTPGYRFYRAVLVP